ncbi:MAG: hypothetical protein UHM85_09750 [Acutalibacteraceae bacterium]|nr:hypothetical protein [Acutalibacteraceae bacterium]
MFKAVLCFFALCLMLSGLFFIFYLVFAKLLKGDAEDYFVIVEGYDESDYLEKQIYSAFIQANMMNFGKKRPVYVVDYNLSTKRKSELIESVSSYGRVIFIKIEDHRAQD